MVASGIQLLGILLIALALFLWEPLVGLAAAGVGAVVVGLALERR